MRLCIESYLVSRSCHYCLSFAKLHSMAAYMACYNIKQLSLYSALIDDNNGDVDGGMGEARMVGYALRQKCTL